MGKIKSTHIRSFVLSALFLLVIYMPFIDNLFHFSTDALPAENRRLAPKPKMNITSLDYYPEKYEAFFDDHFNFRNDLILLYSGFRLNLLGISPFDKVAEGKNGFLFNAHEYLAEYRSKDLFSKSELKRIAQAFEYRQTWCNERRIKYYVAVVPSKPTIYEENTPDFVYRVHGISRYDQLKEYLTENSTFRMIDLKNALLSHKKDYLIYYKTDQHWNNLGAFFGYEAIMKSIKTDFPALDVLSPDDYKLEIDSIGGKGLAWLINKPDDYPDTDIILHPLFTPRAQSGEKANYPIPETFYYKNEYEVRFYIPGSNQPKAMIIRDSFTNALMPYLNETFSETVYIWDNWQYQLNKPIVEQEKPDILLVIMTEIHFFKLLNNIEEFEDLPVN
ncbi:MAG: hypothetical protein JW731_04405 [Bacteroidales bacterium]|nr:hypothetical protein [Bacteroidales bacterium]